MLSPPHAQTIRPTESDPEAAMTTTYTQTHPHPAQSLSDVRVADAMHRGVIKCSPSAPLSVVARILAAHRIHCVVVPSGDARGDWGIVSDLDLVDALLAGELADRTARETAATCMLTVAPNDSLARASQLMHEQRERHVIVVDPSSNAAIGVLSTLDVADVVAELATGER
jgi:CBS domain-containing protein